MKLEITNDNFTGRAMRLAIMGTHYKSPLDWTEKRLADAEKSLHKWYKLLDGVDTIPKVDNEFLQALHDDMNTPKAIALLHKFAKEKKLEELLGGLDLIGLGF